MRKPSRFQAAKPEIISFFTNQNKRIYSYKDISNIVRHQKEPWNLPRNLSVEKFLAQAYKNIDLKEYTIEFPYRNYTKYIWGEVSKYEFYNSLVQNSYFTHQTALFIHQLIDVEPRTVYINFEQSEKPHLRKAFLSQEGIDIAFQRPQRITNNIATFKENTIFLLNGQNTNKTGVSRIFSKYGEIEVTSLERTLIDIVVRPDYAGGIYTVLDSYRKAKNTLSVKVLAEVLKQMRFIYPYHQAIGFLLQTIGISDKALLNIFKEMGTTYDFYLTRQIIDPQYSEEWKLFYPKEMK